MGAYVIIHDRSERLVSPRITIPGTAAIGAFGLSARRNRLFVSDYEIYDTARDNSIYVVNLHITGTTAGVYKHTNSAVAIVRIGIHHGWCTHSVLPINTHTRPARRQRTVPSVAAAPHGNGP